jgi:hypothetical protein
MSAADDGDLSRRINADPEIQEIKAEVERAVDSSVAFEWSNRDDKFECLVLVLNRPGDVKIIGGGHAPLDAAEDALEQAKRGAHA